MLQQIFLTDETPETTEQTKINISLVSSAMMSLQINQ
jgi:hypothetical protein